MKRLLTFLVGLLIIGATAGVANAQTGTTKEVMPDIYALPIIHETKALIIQSENSIEQKTLILNKIKSGYPVIIIGKNAENTLYTILLGKNPKKLSKKELYSMVSIRAKELGFGFSVPLSTSEKDTFQEVIVWREGNSLHVSVISADKGNINNWVLLKTTNKLKEYKYRKINFYSIASSGWSRVTEYEYTKLLYPYGEIYYNVLIKRAIGSDGYQYLSYKFTHESTPGEAYWSNSWKNEEFITYIKFNSYSADHTIYDDVFEIKKYEPHTTVTGGTVSVSFSVPPAGTLSWSYDIPDVTASVVLSRTSDWIKFTHKINGGLPSISTYTAEPGVLWKVHPDVTGVYYKEQFTWKFKKDNQLWPDDHYTKTITKYRYVGIP